jgi:multiple sugar transport system permease protein
MKQNARNTLSALAFIAPWIVGFGVFMAYPLFSALYFSLTTYNVISPPNFIGLDNYVQLIGNDPQFVQALVNTLYMIFIGLTITTIVTLIISVLMDDRRIHGLSFFRVVFFIPTLVPLVILAILWIWILQPDSGVVNSLLRLVGVQGPGWFSSPAWSKPAFILMMLWGAGNMIILYLAGLKDVPSSLYEAAELDGAGYVRRIIHITVPMLRPVILFNVITGIIKVLQSFAESFIITNGGPENSTLFYSLYLYRSAFQYFKMGYASAMAWILLIIALMFVLVMFRSARSWNTSD